MSKCIVKGSCSIIVNGVNYFGGQSVELTSEQLSKVKDKVITSSKPTIKPTNKETQKEGK